MFFKLLPFVSCLVFANQEDNRHMDPVTPVQCPSKIQKNDLIALDAGNHKIGEVVFLKFVIPEYSKKILPTKWNFLTNFDERVEEDKKSPHTYYGVLLHCRYQYTTKKQAATSEEPTRFELVALPPQAIIDIYNRYHFDLLAVSIDEAILTLKRRRTETSPLHANLNILPDLMKLLRFESFLNNRLK